MVSKASTLRTRRGCRSEYCWYGHACYREEEESRTCDRPGCKLPNALHFPDTEVTRYVAPRTQVYKKKRVAPRLVPTDSARYEGVKIDDKDTLRSWHEKLQRKCGAMSQASESGPSSPPAQTTDFPDEKLTRREESGVQQAGVEDTGVEAPDVATSRIEDSDVEESMDTRGLAAADEGDDLMVFESDTEAEARFDKGDANEGGIAQDVWSEAEMIKYGL